MAVSPDIAHIARLVGEPARATMVTALMHGEALTAGELARYAGVTAQTASSHLARLENGGLLVCRRQGRHRYFALADEETGTVIEGLMGLAARAGHERPRSQPRDEALSQARVCYDHLAGRAGVSMLDGALERGLIASGGDRVVLTDAGAAWADGFGIDVARLRSGRRLLCRPCLDWSVRRSHLAGSLGAALLQRIYALRWASRVRGSRIVVFTPRGGALFAQTFGSRSD